VRYVVLFPRRVASDLRPVAPVIGLVARYRGPAGQRHRPVADGRTWFDARVHSVAHLDTPVEG
jgi:hypothetical protein